MGRDRVQYSTNDRDCGQTEPVYSLCLLCGALGIYLTSASHEGGTRTEEGEREENGAKITLCSTTAQAKQEPTPLQRRTTTQ